MDRYPQQAAAAGRAAEQMRLDIASLPQPELRPPAVTKTTSVTGLVTLARCPRQFRWTFVDRLPTRPSTAMRRGVAFHRQLELHNLGKVPLTDFEEAAYDAIDAGEATVASVPPIDVFFASPYAEQRARFAEVPIDLQVGEVRVRGRSDAVYEPEPGAWNLVDYKSGRASDDPALDVQLQTYAIAAVDGAVATPPPDRLTVTFAFFGGGTLVERSVRVDGEWLREARDNVGALAARFVDDRYEPTPSGACERCDFASFCEAGKAFLSRR
jgi:DNA helicase-2/ATP-dependent DNA helicase PcrA